MKGLLDKAGPVGAFFTSLCCLGYPAFISLLTAIGAGVLTRDEYLIPLHVVFLSMSVWGSYGSFKRHGRRSVVIMSAAGAVLTFIGIWVHGAVVALGLTLLIASPVWSMKLLRRRNV